MTAGGTLINQGGITGEVFAVGVEISGASGTVINSGTITGGAGLAGVELTDGGAVTNAPGGTIAGPVEISGASGTVTNAGTISIGSTTSPSVTFGSGTSNNLLVIDPGAVFGDGASATGTTGSSIELAGGGGTISGIGGQFTGFSTLGVDSAATWTTTGTNTIATLLNNGTLDVSGSLTASTAVDPTSTGLFLLAGGATFEVAAALGISSTISFDAGSELVIDSAGQFGKNVGTSQYTGALLEDFGGSTIDIKDFGTAGLTTSYSATTGLLQVTNTSSQVATLDFQNSSLGAGAFHVVSDGGGGVLVTHN
jgi:hypothetical protein